MFFKKSPIQSLTPAISPHLMDFFFVGWTSKNAVYQRLN